MPKVFLIAQPTVTRKGKLPNLEPLAEHGDVHTIIMAGESPTSTPDKALRVIAERLKRFNPVEDFIVWAGGDMLAAIMVGAILERQGVISFKWLRYERRTDPVSGERIDEGATYVPSTIVLYGALNDQAQRIAG